MKECDFQRVDNNCLFVSGYNRHTSFVKNTPRNFPGMVSSMREQPS